MDTRVFQRLRGIRQLAMAQLVYPGALHTRFEHSVGTMHVAARICQRLSEFDYIDEQGTKLVRLAALLHDIGHGPFSHVSEFLLERHYNKAKIGALPERERIHERITLQVIQENEEIGGVLGPRVRTDIVNLLSDTGERDFKRDIVSGPVDADKMDYLRRDSYFAGVEYGRFDLEKIVDACRVVRSGSESFLALHDEAMYALEQFVTAKYHMAQQVWFHRVRSITDAMLVRGMTIAIHGGNQRVRRLFTYDGSGAFLDTYLSFNDEVLLQALGRSANEKVQEICSRLADRRLFKQVCDLPLRAVEHALIRDNLSRLNAETSQARQLEERIGQQLGVDPGFVIVSRWSVPNPTYRPAGYRIEPGTIMMVDSYNVPRKDSQFSDLILSLNKLEASRESIHVYAPRDEWNEPGGGTDHEREQCEQTVKEILISHAS